MANILSYVAESEKKMKVIYYTDGSRLLVEKVADNSVANMFDFGLLKQMATITTKQVLLKASDAAFNTYHYIEDKLLLIGAEMGSHIEQSLLPHPLEIVNEKDGLTFNTGELAIFVNRQLVRGKVTLQYGDIIFCYGIEIFFQHNSIAIRTLSKNARILLPHKSILEFNNQPYILIKKHQLFLSIPENKKILLPEPQKYKQVRATNQQLITSGVFLAISILSNVNMEISRTLPIVSMGMMLLFQLVQFMLTKADYWRKMSKYKQVLATVNKEIMLAEEELTMAIKTMWLLQTTILIPENIYQLPIEHEYYNNFFIGEQKRRLPLEISAEFAIDDTIKSRKMKTKIKHLKNYSTQIIAYPFYFNLTSGYLTIIAPKVKAISYINWLLLHFLQLRSYQSTKVCVISETVDFTWLKWLEHNIYFDTYNKKASLDYLYSLISSQQNNNKTNQLPTFLLIIFDTFLLDHPLWNLLNENHAHINVIYLITNKKQHLAMPINTTFVLEIVDDKRAICKLNYARPVNEEILINGYTQTKAEEHARALSVYREIVNDNLSSNVSIKELYPENNFEQNIQNAWQHNRPYQHLCLPIGKDKHNNILTLNFKEGVHGPHCLIGGTTGSGKSVLLEVLVLGIALNFQPQYVSFILIDFKGGSFAKQFSSLPHHVGTLTNLEKSDINRTILSLQAEIKQRQEKFNGQKVNHIDLYQQIMAERAIEPIPHLFIIIDEFAELKQKMPEFMKELISIARVGRSLGIHLVLATQKPSGIIDEQIWSNCQTKICLRMQTAQDSYEILKTDIACYIQKAGLAYIKTGNSDSLQSVQVANMFYQEKRSNKRMLQQLTKNHQNIDLESNSNAKTITNEITTLINLHGRKFKLTKIPPIWCAQLPKKLFFPSGEIQTNSVQPILELGIIDIPEQQVQKPFTLNITTITDLCIIGEANLGKTTFLCTIIYQIIQKMPIINYRFIIITTINSPLNHFLAAFQIITIISYDDLKTINNFISTMQELLAARANKQSLKIICIVDAAEQILQYSYADKFLALCGQFLQDKTRVSLYLTTQNYNILNKIKFGKFTNFYYFFQSDTTYLTQQTRRLIQYLPQISGRGYYQNKDSNYYIQLGIYDFLANTAQLPKAVIELNNISQQLIPKIQKIMLNDLIPKRTVEAIYSEMLLTQAKNHNILPLGYDITKEKIIYWHITKRHLCYQLSIQYLIQQLQVLSQLLNLLKYEYQIIDPLNELQDYTEFTNIHYQHDKITDFLQLTVKDNRNSSMPLIIIVFNYSYLNNQFLHLQPTLDFLLKNGHSNGVHLICLEIQQQYTMINNWSDKYAQNFYYCEQQEVTDNIQGVAHTKFQFGTLYQKQEIILIT